MHTEYRTEQLGKGEILDEGNVMMRCVAMRHVPGERISIKAY